jgi:hypothetical protein
MFYSRDSGNGGAHVLFVTSIGLSGSHKVQTVSITRRLPGVGRAAESGQLSRLTG